MKKFSCFLVLSVLFLTPLSSQSVVPDIGDNTFFACEELEDDREPGMCFGAVIYKENKKGEDKGSFEVGPQRARRFLKRFTKFFKKQRKKAFRRGDETLAEEFEAKRLNAIQSRQDVFPCYDYYEACSDNSGDDGDDDDEGGNFPSLTEACNLISSPSSYGQLQRNRSAKFIVNGKVCSDNAAASSPVMRIMLDGQQHCTGTYVAANTILTAAHCLENVDCDDLSIENSVGSQIIGASECLSHPKYNKGSEPQANDFGIIKLANGFDGITPAKVVSSNVQVGADAALAGYGRSADDDTKLRATFNAISEITTAVISTQYTRGDVNEGTTCNGDSGGPLFTFQEGEWKTHGTLSDGSAANCALPGTNPKSDKSNWANLADPSNQSFIRDNTTGILD